MSATPCFGMRHSGKLFDVAVKASVQDQQRNASDHSGRVRCRHEAPAGKAKDVAWLQLQAMTWTSCLFHSVVVTDTFAKLRHDMACSAEKLITVRAKYPASYLTMYACSISFRCGLAAPLCIAHFQQHCRRLAVNAAHMANIPAFSIN